MKTAPDWVMDAKTKVQEIDVGAAQKALVVEGKGQPNSGGS